MRLLPHFIVVLLLLTACESTWNTYTRIYVENTSAADSFQVFITYPPSDTTTSLKIKPGTTRLLSTFYLDDQPGARTTKDLNIWLYHYNDTTWTLLSNYGTDAVATNRYLKYVLTDNLEIRASNPNYNDRTLTLTINANLLLEMMQDTLLTDSIFGVR